MNNPNSIEQVIESAELRKSMERVERQDRISDLLESTERLGTSDSVRKLMDSTARPDRISDLLESTERFGISDSVRKLMDCAARSGDISDLLKSTERAAMSPVRPLMDGMAWPRGISDELKHSLGLTAVLAITLTSPFPTCTFRRQPSDGPVRTLGFRPSGKLPRTRIKPLPETNRHLSQLAGTVTQMVEVAKQQAELSQAIRSSADLALKYALQSGEDAKAATVLAAKASGLHPSRSSLPS